MPTDDSIYRKSLKWRAASDHRQVQSREQKLSNELDQCSFEPTFYTTTNNSNNTTNNNNNNNSGYSNNTNGYSNNAPANLPSPRITSSATNHVRRQKKGQDESKRVKSLVNYSRNNPYESATGNAESGGFNQYQQQSQSQGYRQQVKQDERSNVSSSYNGNSSPTHSSSSSVNQDERHLPPPTLIVNSPSQKTLSSYGYSSNNTSSPSNTPKLKAPSPPEFQSQSQSQSQSQQNNPAKNLTETLTHLYTTLQSSIQNSTIERTKLLKVIEIQQTHISDREETYSASRGKAEIIARSFGDVVGMFEQRLLKVEESVSVDLKLIKSQFTSLEKKLDLMEERRAAERTEREEKEKVMEAKVDWIMQVLSKADQKR